MLSVNNLTYTYPEGTQQVLHGLNFSIEEGEIVGFLGPSGAGKSTTQKILIGLLREYGGNARVMGKELSDWGPDYYEQIGVSFELPNHYLKLTAHENLNYFRSLYNNKTRDPLEVLEMVNLANDADKPVSDFSKGMKIRLNLARGLLNYPTVLFLDEPTSGLDPVNAKRVKELVLSERARGTTVFLTTHNMAVADDLCDRVAFITNGHLTLIDAPSALKKQYGKRTVTVAYTNGRDTFQQAEFPLDSLGQNTSFLETLRNNHIETIHTQETTLENIFIQLTGEALTV